MLSRKSKEAGTRSLIGYENYTKLHGRIEQWLEDEGLSDDRQNYDKLRHLKAEEKISSEAE